MVGVASSNLVAPTKFGRKNKHLAETPGAFFCSIDGPSRVHHRIAKGTPAMPNACLRPLFLAFETRDGFFQISKFFA